MALPDDMQVVPVILLKRDVEHADRLAKARRLSRSAFLRSLIEQALRDFLLSDCSVERTENAAEETPAESAA